MLGLTGFLGLTRISLCFWAHTDLSSHSIALWVGNLTDWFCVWAGSRGFRFAFGLTRISQIPQYRFVGGKSHRCFCVWAGSHGFRLVFGLTRISQIPRYCFVGGKSHRCFCVCGLVWAPMGAHCSRSHGFIFRTLRTNQTYRTNWTFLKIIREICGICVRPPWDWDLCEALARYV